MSTVSFTEDGALGVLTLDSPPLNLIGETLIGDLAGAVDRVEATDGLRALLVRGEGKVFSAGADVRLFAGKGSAEMRPFDRVVPGTGAAHRGRAVSDGRGGPWDLHGRRLRARAVLRSDLGRRGHDARTAGDPSRHHPAGGRVERIAARAGLTRARAIAIGGELYAADVLANWGVIDRVLPADELHDSAEAFACALANGPTLAFGVVKQLAHAYLQDGATGADALLLDAAVSLFDTEDASRGIESFMTTGAATTSYEGR